MNITKTPNLANGTFLYLLDLIVKNNLAQSILSQKII